MTSNSNSKSLKRRMNQTAILSFFKAREHRGDLTRVSDETGYSLSHVSNIKAGRRRINDDVANAMYYVSRRRVKQTA